MVGEYRPRYLNFYSFPDKKSFSLSKLTKGNRLDLSLLMTSVFERIENIVRTKKSKLLTF